MAGACATATHGSGVKNSILGTAVSALELVTAEGELIECSRERQGDAFDGMVVSLGGLGIITKLTLDLVPSFAVRQDKNENLLLGKLHEHFETIVASGYSVSLFTDWQGEHMNQVWLKRQVLPDANLSADPTFFGATLARTARHPIGTMPPVHCTPQMGIAGPWHERLPHFRPEFTPGSAAELQSEYFVPRRYTVAALKAITHLRQQLAPILQISEVRTIAADTLWMSPCFREACTAIHLIQMANFATLF